MTTDGFPGLLDALTSRAIPYALLRDRPESTAIRDLDLLIDRAYLQDVLRIAEERGFNTIRAGRTNPGKRVLLQWASGPPRVVDLHERLIYRGIEYMDAQDVLTRRQDRGNCFVPSIEDELLTLFLHNVLGKGEIQAKHVDRLTALLASSLDEGYIAEHLGRFGIAGVFADARREFAMLAGDKARVAEYRRRFLRRLKYRPMSNSLRRARIHVNRYRERWFGRARGVLVAFIGPDGCGKSAITTTLRDELRDATLATDVVYLGPWGQQRLPLHEIIRRLNLRPQKPVEAGAGPPEQTGLLRRSVRYLKGSAYFVLLAVQLWFRYITQVLPRLRRGRIVLADRYIYDIMVGYKNLPLAGHVRLRRWLCRLYRRPDVTILLDAAPSVIYARKPQYEIDELEGIRSGYHEFRQAFDVQVLDTSVSVEATKEDFKRRFLPQVLSALRP